MHAASSKPELNQWVPPPPTTTPLDWAPLAIIDLSRFDEQGGKLALAKELADAVRQWGFWVIIGTGIPQEQVDRVFAIGDAFFKLSKDEKQAITCDHAEGNNFGYRGNTRLVGQTDVVENVEMLNIPKYIPEYDSILRHEFLEAFYDELAPFHRLLWDRAIRKLYILFAIILELPENCASPTDLFWATPDVFFWQLQYHPRPAEDDEKIGSNWTYGHTGKESGYRHFFVPAL
ncbi:hypothetical protein HGRIS_006731 [Hohenbuehelia grisea]|uniref:Non-haem dioxygenase N-terminal domain-containing protein n=1 Tax=Hohenbuehelia grisea TaxID=104357 RepID=A0ABR3JAJ4_9AGAR